MALSHRCWTNVVEMTLEWDPASRLLFLFRKKKTLSSNNAAVASVHSNDFGADASAEHAATPERKQRPYAAAMTRHAYGWHTAGHMCQSCRLPSKVL